MNDENRHDLVLVVDDSVLIRSALTELFESVDVEVDTAVSGEDAIEACKTQHYDVIFLDCRMPGMSGPETARAIRATENGRCTPIIGMSAHDQSMMLEACLSAGMDDFLDKMGGIDAFENALLRWIRTPELAC